eukprot:jgi/Botrbrau1/12717/Bobra.67_1s0080.1
MAGGCFAIMEGGWRTVKVQPINVHVPIWGGVEFNHAADFHSLLDGVAQLCSSLLKHIRVHHPRPAFIGCKPAIQQGVACCGIVLTRIIACGKIMPPDTGADPLCKCVF